MILGIEDDWAAYQLDLAALMAGAKPTAARRSQPAGKFAALKGRARKARVPESGVW